LTVDPQRATDFTICLRIPGWAQGRPAPSDLYRFADAKAPSVTLKMNGQPIDATPQADGYVHITRSWQSSDTVELELPMPIQRVYANEKVEADRGKVALMRGPIVFCLEAVDHRELDVARLGLPRNAPLRAEYHSDLLGGVTVLRGSALTDGKQPVALTAVPYYAWCNREKGPMTVWINESPAEGE
jgi:hypothetical protein